MKENKNIERLFQEKFKDFEMTPPEDSWNLIASKLQQKKKKRRVIPFWYKASGVVALLLISLFLVLNSKNDGVKTSDSDAVVFDKNKKNLEVDKKGNEFLNAIDLVDETGLNKESVVESDAKNLVNPKQDNIVKNTNVIPEENTSIIEKESVVVENVANDAKKLVNPKQNNIVKNTKVIPKGSESSTIVNELLVVENVSNDAKNLVNPKKNNNVENRSTISNESVSSTMVNESVVVENVSNDAKNLVNPKQSNIVKNKNVIPKENTSTIEKESVVVENVANDAKNLVNPKQSNIVKNANVIPKESNSSTIVNESVVVENVANDAKNLVNPKQNNNVKNTKFIPKENTSTIEEGSLVVENSSNDAKNVLKSNEDLVNEDRNSSAIKEDFKLNETSKLLLVDKLNLSDNLTDPNINEDKNAMATQNGVATNKEDLGKVATLGFDNNVAKKIIEEKGIAINDNVIVKDDLDFSTAKNTKSKDNTIVEINKNNTNDLFKIEKLDSGLVKDSAIVITQVETEVNALEQLLKEKEAGRNADEKEEEKRSKWAVSSTAAPVYFNSISQGSPIDNQFDENSKSYTASLSYGLGFQYAISSKVKIRTGVNSMDLNYNTNDVVYSNSLDRVNASTMNVSRNNNAENLILKSKSASDDASLSSDVANFTNDNVASLSQKMAYLEVPLELSYSLLDTKFGIEFIGGMSTLFLNKNEISLVSDDGSEMIIGEATNINTIHFSGNVGLGFKYSFWKSFSANFQPMFKYQINTFNADSGNFKPYVIGLYSGISFNF